MRRLSGRHFIIAIVFLIPILVVGGVLLFADDDPTIKSELFSFLPYYSQNDLSVGETTLQISPQGEIVQARMRIRRGPSAIYEVTYDQATDQFTETQLSGLRTALTISALEKYMAPILETFSGQAFTVEYELPPSYTATPALPDWPLIYRASLADGTLELLDSTRLSAAQLKHLLNGGRIYLTLEDGSHAFVGLAVDHNMPAE